MKKSFLFLAAAVIANLFSVQRLQGQNNSSYWDNNKSIQGNRNSAFGDQSLKSTTGNDNTGIGYVALYFNQTGSQNTALGSQALHNNHGNNNTAAGYLALYNLNNASYNTAVGGKALYNIKAGFFNTAVGYESLKGSESVSETDLNRGQYNTAAGYQALFSSYNGEGNTGTGSFSLYSNKNGKYNTATGFQTLVKNTSDFNTAFGAFALYENTTGIQNTATGAGALSNNTTGFYNTAQGAWSLQSNEVGSQNTAVGYHALSRNKNAHDNTALGAYALQYNLTGKANTAIGIDGLRYNETGSWNVALGGFALRFNQGYANTAVGYRALDSNVTGNYNTALGNNALAKNKSGTENTALGFRAGEVHENNRSIFIGSNSGSTGNVTNSIAIGYGVNVSNSDEVKIGNTYIKTIRGEVNWTTTSDGRYKKNIREDVPGLAFINQLRPVTYNLDVNGIANKLNAGRQSSAADGNEEMAKANVQAEAEQQKARAEKSKITYTGFVAQEVEDAAQKLNYDFSGVDKPKSKDGLYGLRYSEFVVPLVKAVQELSKENDQLKQDVIELKEMVSKLLKGQSVNANAFNLTSGAYVEQNAPNPFSNTTIIRYHLPTSVASARLLITGINGQELRSFTLSTGDGQVTLNAGTLAAGTYSYSLVVDGRIADTKQLVITR